MVKSDNVRLIETLKRIKHELYHVQPLKSSQTIVLTMQAKLKQEFGEHNYN